MGGARAGAGQVLAVRQNHLHFFRKIAKTRDGISRKSRIGHAAVLGVDLFAEDGAGPHEDAAFHLGTRVPGVEDRAAFECFHDLDQADGSLLRIDLRIHAGGGQGVFLFSAGKPGAAVERAPGGTPLLPAGFLGSGGEDSADALVAEMREPEFQRIGVVRLPAVMPSSGVRAVSQRITRIRSSTTPSVPAAAMASSVRGPCPSSALPLKTVNIPSSPTCMRASTLSPRRWLERSREKQVSSHPAPGDSGQCRRVISKRYRAARTARSGPARRFHSAARTPSCFWAELRRRRAAGSKAATIRG